MSPPGASEPPWHAISRPHASMPFGPSPSSPTRLGSAAAIAYLKDVAMVTEATTQKRGGDEDAPPFLLFLLLNDGFITNQYSRINHRGKQVDNLSSA